MKNLNSNNFLEDSKNKILNKFLSKDKVKLYFQHIKYDNSLDSEYFYEKINGIYEEIREDLRDLLKLAEINLVPIEHSQTIDHNTWKYICYPLKTKDLDLYTPLFFYEWSLYPITFLKKLGLKSIILTNSITFKTDTYSQYRAAIPDYFDKSRAMVYCCKERDAKYIRNVIHHELFHYFDFIEDGIIYGPDYEWEKFNISEFSYGNGGANNREWKDLCPEMKGFLNFYCTTGVEEDKAEIFAYMMNRPMDNLSIECEIIKSKITYIKKCLMNFDRKGFDIKNYWDWLIDKRD